MDYKDEPIGRWPMVIGAAVGVLAVLASWWWS